MGALLFAASEPGAWYDPSDLSTLFQDSAGSTPVTAVEQPVGRMLDKSGRGNHATQVTATKRPVFSRRYNAVGNITTPTGGTATIVTAGYPADMTFVQLTKTSISDEVCYELAVPSAAPGRWVFSLVVDTAVSWPIYDATLGSAYTLGGYVNFIFNAGTKTVSFGATTGSATGISASATQVSGSIYRLTYAVNLPDPPGALFRFYIFSGAGLGSPGRIISQVSAVREADAHLPYQWVNTATDYDADPNKFPAYLRFDGADDALQTANIDFTSTDKMTVWAGITKLSDTATGTVVELSALKNTNNGVFALFAPLSPGSPEIAWYSKGTSERSAASASESAPVTRVITGIGDISGDISRLRVNGAVVQTQTADQGTGNFGNYPLYIGARNQSSLYLNGRLYSLIVRGAQTPLSQIEATELYIKQKMRMP